MRRPRPSSRPGLGSSHALSALARWLGRCTWVTTLGPKRSTRGGPASPKQASKWARRLLVAFRETGLIGLEDPGCHLPGVTSPFAYPAPLPGPGLGLATTLAPPAWGSCRCTWVTTLGPKRATRGGPASPKQPSQLAGSLLVAFQETGLIGLEDPGRHLQGVTSPFAGPAPLPSPGLCLATPLAPPIKGSGHCTCVTTLGPERATRAGPASPKQPSEWA